METWMEPKQYTATGFRKMRENWGISQKNLANLLGIHQTTIAAWERDGVSENPLLRRGLAETIKEIKEKYRME